ncbi:MAG: glycosyltransferase family 2 protein [Candidatus Zambryskibacteria bacterium]|nr:glycosyltransferase family 2 protein [Candidatus Zambryskibacteria bacterium]
MYRGKKVSVVIPTYNESQTIRQVIDSFFATGFVDEVLVVDNNAIGNTKEEVGKTRARLIVETKQGYGNALMCGLAQASGDLVVMVEADGTFEPADLHKFLLYSDDFPVVFGTRTSRAAIWSGAFMPFPVRFANWLWAKVIEVLYNGPVLTDVGCTFKLINRNSLEKIKKYFALSKGDGTFSPELMIWLVHHEKKIIEIPVIYKERVGESGYTGSVWKAGKLGFKMLPLIIKYRFKKI